MAETALETAFKKRGPIGFVLCIQGPSNIHSDFENIEMISRVKQIHAENTESMFT